MLNSISKCCFFFSLTFILACNSADTQSSFEKHDAKVVKVAENDTISKRIFISAVGDCMIGTNYPSQNCLPPNDGKDIFSESAPYLRKSDLSFGNCEGCFLTGLGPVKTCSDSTTVCYAFKMPDHFVNHFLDAGFDVLSIANNHVGDFGDVGRINTQNVLSSAGLQYAGLKDCPSTKFEKNGVKYGFCAFAPNSGTVSLNDISKAQLIVRELDKACDIVIVSFHGGGEGCSHRHLTDSVEMYIGENRGNLKHFAKSVIDAGADVVFGHGPHVPRAMDIYKGKFIAYSLGNFATYARFSLRSYAGLAPLVTIEVNDKGDFISGEIISFIQEGRGGPKLDSLNRAAKEIKELSENDLPFSELLISNEGKIIRR
jgi:hypothetical protein